MKPWEKTLIKKDYSLREAILAIDQAALQIGLVVDNNSKLLGTLSDGDIRRAIIKGVELSEKVNTFMNKNPTVATESSSPIQILGLMRKKCLRHVPIINADNQIVGLMTLNELVGDGGVKSNPVVIMAGGLGTRLLPLTKNCPKPMLVVDGKPILEHLLLHFISQNFNNFYISVNYLGAVVEDYFGDGAKWGVSISYLREKEKLGTAGALSLLPLDISDQIIVINGDVLTKTNFDGILNFHIEHSSSVTVAVREYDMQVPFGVVELNDHIVTGIIEKPVHSFYVNAGIYMISPDILRHVPNDTYLDMPTLFKKILAIGKSISAYPLHEYWIDIGRTSEYEKAQIEWRSN